MTLYLFCLFLVYFSILETSVESRFTLGYVFIAIFILWVSLNIAVMVWHAVKFIKQLLKRSYFRYNDRKLATKVAKVITKLDVELEANNDCNPFKDEKTEDIDRYTVETKCVVL